MKYTFPNAIVFFTFLFWLPAPVEGTAQPNSIRISGNSLIVLRQDTLNKIKGVLPGDFSPLLKGLHIRETSPAPPRLSAIRQPAGAVPLIYSYHDLGIFCKLEVQLERTTNIPIKFRLGDVQYVDWLEGKRDRPGY